MTTGREILTSQSISTVRAGQTVATRKFSTEATTQSAAEKWITEELTPSVVTLGSQYPGAPQLVVDRLDYSPTSDGTYEITANYSTSGLFVLDKPNKLELGYYSWYFSWKDRNYDVPVAVREPWIINGTTVGNIWRPRKRVTTVTNVLMHLEIRTAHKLTLGEVKLIASKVNNLHALFGGTTDLYLFTGGEVRDGNDNAQFVTYTWEKEQKQKGFFPGGSYLGQPKIDYDDNGGTLRLPDPDRNAYEDWTAFVTVNGPTFAPQFLSVPKYDKDPNGWGDLPGVNGAMFQ